MDVTGTMVSFSGTLEDHYTKAMARCNVKGVDRSKIAPAFQKAYHDTTEKYPCFGGSKMTAKEWWRKCVLQTLELSGSEMTDESRELVFQRVYGIFGSHDAYSAFPDAMPFLDWAQRHRMVCGVLSNADQRYGDAILPMLDLANGMSFMCFSKDLEVQKPESASYMALLEAARPWLPHADDPLLPSQVLHIGNDFEKDFDGPTRVGMRALLLDRFDEKEVARQWRIQGAPVFKDLLDVVEYLGRNACKLG